MTGRVAVLGTGIMGTGMARNLLGAGLDVTVWNRTSERAEPLAAHGVRVADSPAGAVAGADVIVTMLFDAAAVREVLEPALGEADGDVVWAQMATVGVSGAESLAELAAAHHVGYVDAPVLGTKKPAEDGTLTVLAAGSRKYEARLAPVFDAVGSRTTWVSEHPGDGSRLKLVLNAWVQTITLATAQSVAFSRALGIDPRLFLEGITGTATDSPYAHLKGEAMIADDYRPAFRLDGALKDAALIVAAMREAGVETAVMDAITAQFRRMADEGRGAEDMGVVRHAF